MIILNELEYAERCLKNDDIGEKPYTTISILAKYYYHHLGYKRKRIIEELQAFLVRANEIEYNNARASWDNYIESAATGAKKFKLHEIEGIWITDAELQTIADIHNKVLERLAFSMLCLAKLAMQKNGNSNGWVNQDAKTIFSLARISGSISDRYMRLADLCDMGLLELPKKNDVLSYRVTFINDESKNNLFIHDFRELGYEYLKYCGQNFIRCEECGILTRGNKSKTKRYCSSCAAYTPQEIKKITCMDCGKTFKTNSLNAKSCRCQDCQKKYRKNYQRELMRKRRNNDC